MKFNGTVISKLLIVVSIICVSCAGHSPPPETFESVHTNTKHIENIAEALVVGETVIGAKQFKVSYYLAQAVAIDGQGYQIPFLLENLTDNVSQNGEFMWRPAENDAGVLISLDDFFLDSWLRYFDTFTQYGAKVTFFVHSRPESRGDNAVTLADFCAQALSRGHDIGFHTLGHTNLTKVPRDVFIKETIEGAQAFKKAGIPLSAFAYPFGMSQPWMNETLSPIFPMLRGFDRNTHLYPSHTINNGYIDSKAIDNVIYPNNADFENELRLLLLIAKFTGNIIIPLTTHDISDTAQWGITPSRLEFLLGTIQQLKLRFYTFRELQG